MSFQEEEVGCYIPPFSLRILKHLKTYTVNTTRQTRLNNPALINRNGQLKTDEVLHVLKLNV